MISEVGPLPAALADNAVLRMTREACSCAHTNDAALAHFDSAATAAVTSSAFAESTSQADRRYLGTLSIALQQP